MNYQGLAIEPVVTQATDSFIIRYRWPATLAGLPLLGAGASKATYALPNGQHVLKIGSPVDGYNQIPNEIAVWIYAPKELESDLAQIIDFGQNWIIAERCVPISQLDHLDLTAAYALADRLNGRYSRWPIGDLICNDGNIGQRLSDGTFCAIDYSGGFCRPDWVGY